MTNVSYCSARLFGVALGQLVSVLMLKTWQTTAFAIRASSVESVRTCVAPRPLGRPVSTSRPDTARASSSAVSALVQ